jgi:hypothetical protein
MTFIIHSFIEPPPFPLSKAQGVVNYESNLQNTSAALQPPKPEAVLRQ